MITKCHIYVVSVRIKYECISKFRHTEIQCVSTSFLFSLMCFSCLDRWREQPFPQPDELVLEIEQFTKQRRRTHDGFGVTKVRPRRRGAERSGEKK